MLLSVIDLAAQGRIKGNFIEPSRDLVETFNGYWQLVVPPGGGHGERGTRGHGERATRGHGERGTRGN